MALRTLDVADGFSMESVPSDAALPVGAATEATLALIKAKTDNLDVALSTLQTKINNLDVALSTLATKTSNDSIKTNTDKLDVNLSTVAKDATLTAQNTLIGDVVETAPASDTASSGLNGRLQRIAQRLTSLIALFPSSIGQKTKTGSLSVVLASDQGNLSVTQGANANGSIVNGTLSGTTATSNIAPANAVGFFIEASSSNDQNIRWCVGSTASATVGMRLEAGRSGDSFIPCTGTVSVCAEASGTNSFMIQWVLSV